MEVSQIFLACWLVLAITMIYIMYYRGKKALKIFPELNESDILFREKYASGNSLKSFRTKMGGASGVLDVIITNDELWIKTLTLIAGFGNQFDLLHKVKLNQISAIKIQKNKIKINFQVTNQTKTALLLRLKRGKEFYKIINDNLN